MKKIDHAMSYGTELYGYNLEIRIDGEDYFIDLKDIEIETSYDSQCEGYIVDDVSITKAEDSDQNALTDEQLRAMEKLIVDYGHEHDTLLSL
jgi:hypothetical protein